MNLKIECSVQLFRKMIDIYLQLNIVIIWKSTNKYHRNIISKNGDKMDLYPAMLLCTEQFHNEISLSEKNVCRVERNRKLRAEEIWADTQPAI